MVPDHIITFGKTTLANATFRGPLLDGGGHNGGQLFRLGPGSHLQVHHQGTEEVETERKVLRQQVTIRWLS